MNHPSFYLFFTLAIRAIELLGATGMVVLVSRWWVTEPEFFVVRFVRHRQGIWFALGLFFLPLALGRVAFLLGIFRPYGPGGPSVSGMAGVAGLCLFDGIVYGLAGCLLAVAGKTEEKFRLGIALGIALGAVILLSGLPLVLGAYRFGPGGNVPEILIMVVFLTFMVSRAFQRQTTETVAGDPRPAGSPALALVLAFLPSALLLGFFTFINRSPSAQLQAAPLFAACGVSIVCCFTSAIMLFRRNTGLAIFAGILFLILNIVVSFLLGCGAVLSGMKF